MRNRYIEGLEYPLPHPFRVESEQLAVQFDINTYKVSGVIRWRSNNHVPPQEVLDFWRFIGKRFNMSMSIRARTKDTNMALRNYRRNQADKSVTDEAMYEMQAAFGKGAEVIDVITGRKTKI